jgi:hypothetical protein
MVTGGGGSRSGQGRQIEDFHYLLPLLLCVHLSQLHTLPVPAPPLASAIACCPGPHEQTIVVFTERQFYLHLMHHHTLGMG